MRSITNATIAAALERTLGGARSRIVPIERPRRAVVGQRVFDPRQHRAGRLYAGKEAAARADVGAKRPNGCLMADPRPPLIREGDPLICTPGNMPACNAKFVTKVSVAKGASGTLTWDVSTMNYEKFRVHGVAFLGVDILVPEDDVTRGMEIDDLELRGKDYLGSANQNCGFYSVYAEEALEPVGIIPDLNNGGANLTGSVTNVTDGTSGADILLYAVLYGEGIW